MSSAVPMPPASKRHATRHRILQAASEIAQEIGANGLSLDAVAAKAGVSKGGLLYHFPSKSKLLTAAVESFVEEYEEQLRSCEEKRRKSDHAFAHAFLDMFLQDSRCNRKPPSGILAALAEDPSFLDPVREHERGILQRLKEDLGDADLASLVYFTIAGLKSSHLLDLNVVPDEEGQRVAERLRSLLLNKVADARS